jgi:hypothetical protein
MLNPQMQERLERYQRPIAPLAKEKKVVTAKIPSFVSRKNYGDEPKEEYDRRNK